MKFTPEVIAALTILRANAENDFELHRIDVLEHDLTDPPTVEMVNDHQQTFNGEKFNMTPSGHLRNQKAIHQRVWEYHHGIPPSGYEIHHVDGNKANNNITNLQLLTRSEHQSIHMPQGTTRRPKLQFTCACCGKKYVATTCGKNKFCSQQCRNKYRQEHELTKRVCPHCGKEFETYKANCARFCSHSCAMDAKRKHPIEKRICPICGQEFTTNTRLNQRFCSRSCASEGRKRKI